MLLFNIHSKGIGPLSWLLRIITFLITLLQWSSTRSGYAGLAVTAMASVNGPGEMEPQLLSILIGSNGTITCRLSKPNSSRIWFFDTTSKRRIKQPSEEIKIIDPYTAILSIQNAVEQKSWYQCMVENQGIALSAVHVGTLPLNVTDFACLVYDYEYMQCSFTKPKNMLMTTFDLEYRFADDNSKHSCNLSEVPEQEHKQHCNVSDYFPMRDKYLFKLIGSNTGGTNVQQFTISNHKIVIPSALKVSAQNITSDSVTLTLQNLKISYYRMGLLYEIKIRDNHSDWRTEQTGLMENSAVTCNVVINNLYSYWNYSIEVRAKSKVADENDAHLWSEPSAITFRTGRRRPVKAPDTPRGSFDIDSAENQFWLYWGHLPENEYSGPNFHYIVNEIDSNGVVIDSIPVNETSLSVKWRNESIQTFSIKSANEDGPSEKGNIIRVYRRRPQYELNEENIAKVYHNSSYTLSWSPPANLDELDNFTVFWCLPKIESSNQCKGPISYKYLDKHTTRFTTEPKDRSLNLAISANYPMYSRGMQWARCSSLVSSELMKVELEVTAWNESSVMVKWNSGSVCPSVLKGYNLTYCQACHCTPNGHCDGGTPQTVQLLPEFRNYTIHNLPSYTTVCLSMFMFSSVKRGRDSEYKCDRTKASAPSPPKNVSVNAATITSKSAKIEWSPPDVHNGILTHYTIHWRKIPYNTSEKATTYINQTSYNLTGLSSYSNYEVYVTAHTVEESPKSERITISTLIGIPSSPRNISVHNETMIFWDQPDLPSGRHVFYIVALLRHNKKEHKSAFQQVSVVRGRSCRYNLPDCPSSDMSYTLEVRAVNVGERDEIDTEIIPMSRDVILAGAEIDQSFCVPNNVEESDEDWAFIDDGTKSYFASPWVEAGRLIQCSTDTSALIYAMAFVIVIIFGVYVCHWIRNKYYKMKNIKVILPEGLVDQVSNYKFAGNVLSNGRDLESVSKKEFHSDISRSNDCLVAFGHNDNHNLVSNFHNRSSNAPSSLSSDSSSKDHQNDDQIGEHPSLETTNEELSSNSSSSSHSNLTYHDHHQIQRLSAMDSKHTLNMGSCEQDEDDANNAIEYNEEYNQSNVNTAQNIGDNGYVTHNTQLLASILNATERPVPPSFPTSFPTMTTDGYIQPSAAKQFFQPQIHHPPPPASQNGYTSVEALLKISTMPDETTQNLTSPTLPSSITTNPRPFARNSVSTAQTSPVITNLEETDHHSKDVLSPSVETAPDALHPTNNNNNNTIFGYVTQQQLANFGTNVALAKELNT